jgi:hypothetical protein
MVAAQINRMGLQIIVASVQDVLNRNVPPATSNSLIESLANKATLARAIVENAVAVDGGRAAFCTATYILEGDNPSVSVAHKVLSVAEMKHPELEEAAKIAANLVREDFRLLTVSVRETMRRLDDAQIASSSEDE